MATLSKAELKSALVRLGQLAEADGEHIELLLFGGSAMVLAFDARAATRDVDVVILARPIEPKSDGWRRLWRQSTAGRRIG